MYRDASEESIDSQIRENLSVDDLSAESIASYRTSYGIHHDSHAWTELPTDEFLCRIGAAKIGAGGAIHPTSAGLLMFGEEWRIMAEFPHFFLDYRQELDPDERWQMRITSQDDSWSGNVFDFYRRVYNRRFRRPAGSTRTACASMRRTRTTPCARRWRTASPMPTTTNGAESSSSGKRTSFASPILEASASTSKRPTSAATLTLAMRP